MTKKEFIRRVAKNQKNSILETRYWVDIVLEELKKAVIDEESIDLYGFGKFEHALMQGHNIRNPAEGKVIYHPAWVKLKFTPSKYVKAAIKDGLTAAEFEERLEDIRAFRRGENDKVRCVTNGRPVMKDEEDATEEIV